MKRNRFIACLVAALIAIYPSFVFAQVHVPVGTICSDGSISKSHGRGTCSHHGGISHSSSVTVPVYAPTPTYVAPAYVPAPTLTPTAILLPTATATPIPLAEPTNSAPIASTALVSTTNATVLADANLRTGPGTDYSVIGGAPAGQIVTIVGQDEDGSWYHLASGQWIAAFLVELAK